MSRFENLSSGNKESFYSWIEAAPIPIMLYDENGEIIKVSSVRTDITGYTNKEIPTLAAWIDRAVVDKKDEAAASFRTLFQLRSRQHDGLAAERRPK